MIIGVLLIAFPVTVLSVNFGQVYSAYRIKNEAKPLKSKAVHPVTLNKDQLELIKTMNQDIIICSNKVDEMTNKLSTLNDAQMDLSKCLDILKG